MPYLLEWIIPDVLLYERSYGLVTLEELQTMTHEIEAHAAQVPGRVLHMLLDATVADTSKLTLGNLAVLMRSMSKDNRTQGWVVTITPDMLQRLMGTVVSQIRGVRERQFKTIEEGLTFLASHSDNLPPYDELFALYEQAHGKVMQQIEREQP